MAESVSWVSAKPVGEVDFETKRAGDLGGFVNRVVGGRVITESMMKRELVSVIEEALAEPEDAEFEYLLAAWPGYDWSKSFKAEHKLVTTESGQPAVVQLIPGLTDTALADMGPGTDEVLRSYVQVRSAVVAGDDADGSSVKKLKKKKKVYELGSFFHDVDVVDKYTIPDQLMALVRRTAVVDAAGACGILRRWLRQRGHDVEVRPGGYAKGGKSAKTLLLAASEAAAVVAPLQPPTIVGSEIYFENAPGDALGTWSVSGPLRHAEVVRGVAAMVVLRGVSAVATLFADQLVRLGVDVLSKDAPISFPEQHAGSRVERLDGTVSAVSAIATWVEPLVGDDGTLRGSSIRISTDTSVANGHVFGIDGEKAKLTLGGSLVTVVSKCSADALLVQHSVVDTSVPYSQVTFVREALEGEPARLVGASTAGGDVRDFGQVSVRRVEPGVLVTTVAPYAVHGCSGSSLVAVSDGALLGMYHGSTRWDSVFVPALEFAAVMDSPPLPTALFPGAVRDGLAVHARLVARGMGSQLAAIDRSLEGLFIGEKCVGSGLMGRSGLLTTLDPSLWPVEAGGELCREVASDGAKFVLAGAAALSIPFSGRSRAPAFGERVALMGRDAEGDIFMTVVTTVNSLVRDRCFHLVDPGGLQHVALCGAVVVAMADGAVLGMCAGMSQGYSSVVLKSVVLADCELRARSALVELVPRVAGLDMRLFSEDMCRSVLSESVNGSGLAVLGEAIVRKISPDTSVIYHGLFYRKMSRALMKRAVITVGLDTGQVMLRLIGAVCKVSGKDDAVVLAQAMSKRDEERPESWCVGGSAVSDFAASSL